tara:strand:+ start:427 stop:543 length:117 start_codon:yes stop_codon:yes gene_type:complete
MTNKLIRLFITGDKSDDELYKIFNLIKEEIKIDCNLIN